MIIKPTQRGFKRAEFVDRYGAKCSIQESSLATEYCIWLGCESETVDLQGRPCGARMHVSQELAAELIPLLQVFVATGLLPDASDSPPVPESP
jgi:hypothetical protein